MNESLNRTSFLAMMKSMNSASQGMASDGSMSKISCHELAFHHGRLLQLGYQTTIWDAYVKDDQLFIYDSLYRTEFQIECALIIAAEYDYIDTEYVKCLTSRGVGWVYRRDMCDV